MTVPKLIADFETGEGDVKFPDEWNEESSLMRADLLKDCIDILMTEYDASVSTICRAGAFDA